MLSAPGVARLNDAAAAAMQLIRRASYSLRSGARARRSLLGVNALIEGVKARVSNYLPALVSLAQLITPRPQTASLVSMLWRNLRAMGAAINFEPFARLAYVASYSRLNLILNCYYAATPLTVHIT